MTDNIKAPHRGWLFLLPLLWSHAWAQTGNPQAEKWLRQQLTTLGQDTRLGGGQVSWVVMEVMRGRVLAEHGADQGLSVASNVKLITSAAALSTLGPSFRFRTEAHVIRPAGRQVAETIYLKGFGDPTLREEDLWKLAQSVRRAGITRVEKGLRLDESYFDAQRLAPLYETRNGDSYYRPACGALSLNGNVVWVRVQPGARPGHPALVSLVPQSSYFALSNSVTTVSRNRRSYVLVSAGPAGAKTAVRVRGRVRVGLSPKWERKRVAHPGLLTGITFADKLAQNGVVLGEHRVGRGEVPATSYPVAVHVSGPLSQVVRHMNKHSDNMIAEQLVKVMGAEVYGPPGTWPKGLSVIRRYLDSLGIKKGSYQIKNGSGLYEASSLSPRQLVKVLRTAWTDFRISAEFVASLSVAAVDGTLAHRMVGTGAEHYVRAKTGTLSSVVSLSGYAGSSKRQQTLVFSIIATELPEGRIRSARKVVDEMVQRMVSYLER